MASAGWVKLTSPHAAGLKKHLEPEERLKVNHSNTNIDNSKSHLNITIGCNSYKEALAAMRSRVKQVDKDYPPLKKKKTDERVIAEMIEIKCPAEIVQRGYDAVCAYFKGVYTILQQFFGSENVHGCFVHFDEIHAYTDKDGITQTSLPHGHFLVSAYCEWQERVIVNGEKTNEIRQRQGINGKNFEKRPRYNQLNKLIDEYCMEHYEIAYTKGKGKEPGYGKSVEELKATEKVNQLTQQANEQEARRIREQQAAELARKELETYKQKIVEMQTEIDNYKKTIEELSTTIESLKEIIDVLKQALTTATVDTKETKTVKGFLGIEKEVPKTPSELQRDKEIAAAKYVLQREESVEKREADCAASERELSNRIALERKQAADHQRIADEKVREEDQRKAEQEKKRLQEECDRTVRDIQEQLIYALDRMDAFEEVADEYAYMIEDVNIPEDLQPLNYECWRRLQALKQNQIIPQYKEQGFEKQ